MTEKPGVVYAPHYMLPVGDSHIKQMHTADIIDVRLIEFKDHPPQAYVGIACSPLPFGMVTFLQEEGIEDMIRLLQGCLGDIERIKLGELPQKNMLLAPEDLEPKGPAN